MSEQTPAPNAPQTPAPEATKPPARADYVAAAKAKLAAMAQEAPPVDPTAPTQPAPAPPPSKPSAAAAVLGGQPVTPPTPETPAIDASDPRAMGAMAQILALEQESRRQLEALTQRERELASRGEKLSVYEKAEQAKAAGNLVGALEALGIDYEALTAQIVRGDAGALQPATEELRKLQAEIEAVRKEAVEREQKAAEQAATARVEAYKAQVKAQLQSDPKRWELLLSPIGNEGRDPVSLIESTMEAHFLATGGRIDEATGQLVGGERLTAEQAADMLEAEIERRTREAATIGGEKLRRILALTGAAPPASSAPPVTAPAPTHPAPAPTTTTTELSTRSSAPDRNRPKSARDYREAGRLEAARQLQKRHT